MKVISVQPTPQTWVVNYFQTTTLKNVTLNDFAMNNFETTVIWDLQKELNVHVLQRLTVGKTFKTISVLLE